MYRAVTWYAIQRGVNPRDEDALARLAESSTIAVRDAPRTTSELTQVIVHGLDATPHLRDAAVEANVSLVSRVPRVRSALQRIQRSIAGHGAVVMAGRDIGSVVLPDADLKVYLDASREVRAARRAEQLRATGVHPDLRVLGDDLAERDRIDSTRNASPLTAAHDAVIIHTDDLSVAEVVERILHAAT